MKKPNYMIKSTMLFLIFIGLCGVVMAALPGVPHQFYGTVTTDGNPVADGLMITAEIGGEEIAATVTLDGSYGLSPDIFYVQDPDNNRQGETITFYVSDKEAGSAVFTNGGSTELNLDASGLEAPAFCGDGTCNGGETCSTCPTDCGSCNTGGGSTGGGSPIFAKGGDDDSGDDDSTTTTTLPEDDTKTDGTEINFEAASCVPEWDCSDWLDCINGQQKRVCVDINKCGDNTDKPDEVQECITPEQAVEDEGLEDITGAAVFGVGKTTLTVSLIAAIIVAVAVMLLIYRKNK